MLQAEFHPVTPARFSELIRFVLPRGRLGHGRFAYCSCMRWRLTSGQFRLTNTTTRGLALRSMARNGIPVGVLGYVDGAPIAWCSVAPRETYAALERYRALPRLDDQPVWSVVCFFVGGAYRGQGLTTALLQAAVGYARSMGARIVEGYPVQPGHRLYTYMGSPGTFERVGFRDVTPPGQRRRVMRLDLRGQRASPARRLTSGG